MSKYDNYNDEELIEELRELDEGDEVNLSKWELDFIDSILARHTLTDKQRVKVVELLEKHT